MTHYGTGTMTRDVTGRTTLGAIFEDREAAERAVNDLRDAGFTSDQVGVAARDRDAQNQVVEDTEGAEGLGIGAATGAVLGGITGFVAGISTIAIPGIGPVVGAGILGTTAAGAGLGAVGGGLVGGLIGLGIPEEEATHFESGVRAGNILVTVQAEGRAPEALTILERHGGDTGPGSPAYHSY